MASPSTVPLKSWRAKLGGVQLLTVDLACALTADRDFEQVLRLLFREAWFQDAILYLDGLDVLRSDERSLQYRRLLEALAEDRGITILAGIQSWVPSGGAPIGVVPVPFPIPDFTGRRACWQANLVAEGITVHGPNLDALADRFRLTSDQIADVVVTGRNYTRWHTAADAHGEVLPQSSVSPTVSDLFAAARAQFGHDLAARAHKIEPVYTWSDIVLSHDTLAQLHEMCRRITHPKLKKL